MTHAEIAKKLGYKYRIGKYGINLLPHTLGGGRKLISVTSLDGWIFDPKEIAQAFADDDEFSIKYKEK